MIRWVRVFALFMIIEQLDQLVRLKMGPVDQRDDAPSNIDKEGRRHYLSRAIPYQDLQQEAERLKAVHEARVKIVPSL